MEQLQKLYIHKVWLSIVATNITMTFFTAMISFSKLFFLFTALYSFTTYWFISLCNCNMVLAMQVISMQPCRR